MDDPRPKAALARLLRDKIARREQRYEHIIGRTEVEQLHRHHVHRWLVDWMNRQLSNIGINSTGGVELPPLHFDLIETVNDVPAAHVFETDEYGFIVLARPMIDQMETLSHRFVQQNLALMNLQIAPSANPRTIGQLLLLMQFSVVTSHEYSHMVRHLNAESPASVEIGDSLLQMQESDADGYGIYHDLTYFFLGEGRDFASDFLKLTGKEALDNSMLSCFLFAILLLFCSRWAEKDRIEFSEQLEHPPIPLRIGNAFLFVEMWCREVGNISTSWITDGTLNSYFGAVARLFSPRVREAWYEQMLLFKSPESAEYQRRSRRALDLLRTGESATSSPE